MNENEQEEILFNFKISANLQQIKTLLCDEVNPYIVFLTDKYLKVIKSIENQEQRELISNCLFYDYQFQSLIIEAVTENEDPIPVKFIFKEFVSHIEKYHDILNHLSEQFSHGLTPNIKIRSIKNKRRTLEDKTCCSSNILLSVCHRDEIKEKMSLFGVFDGHSGVHAAQYLSLCLHYRFASSLLVYFSQNPEFLSTQTLSSCLGNIIKEMNISYIKNYQDKKSGSTLNLVLKLEKTLIFINLGDSQAYIMKNDGTFINMTPLLHNLSVESERDYVISKDGDVSVDDDGMYRIKKRFCLSRTFGDGEFQPYFNPEPDIITYNIDGTEKCVIIGTDGFWEGVSPYELASSLTQTTSKMDMDQCVDTFVQNAKLEVEDNITVMVVPL